MEIKKQRMVHKLMLEVLNPGKNETMWVRPDGFINLNYNSLMQQFNHLNTQSLELNELTLQISDYIEFLELLKTQYNLIDQYEVENDIDVNIKFHNHSMVNNEAIKEYNLLYAIKIDTEQNNTEFI